MNKLHEPKVTSKLHKNYLNPTRHPDLVICQMSIIKNNLLKHNPQVKGKNKCYFS